MKRISTIFFLSGISGLIYQVLWVREFGRVFGNTMYSAAIVTGLFMFGLGLGGYLAGVYGDRKPEKVLKAYALTEIAVAIWGLLIAVNISNLEYFSIKFSNYIQKENGWFYLSTGSYFFRYLLYGFLILPITSFMGATLTLLIKYVLKGAPGSSGFRIGLLYGINTAGAALGCLMVDHSLVPWLGIHGTHYIAIGLNIVAGLWALTLKNNIQKTNFEKPASWFPSFNLILLLSTTAISAMGLELIWFRFFTSYFGANRNTFSIILFVVLTGIWIGAVLSGYLSKRFKKDLEIIAYTQVFLVIMTLGSFYYIEPNQVFVFITDIWFSAQALELTPFRESVTHLLIAFIFMGVPALCMGFVYPLANNFIQNTEEQVGQKAGLLYFINTSGALIGSILAGFFLIPAFGMQRSLLILCLIGLVSLVSIFLLIKKKRIFISLGLGLITCFLWTRVRPYTVLTKSFANKSKVLAENQIISISEGVNESIVVGQHKKTGYRTLFTNGHQMTANSTHAQRYMRSFIHLPMMHLKDPKDLLVICFGVGNTVHAASLYDSLTNIEVADLSEHVLKNARFFERTNKKVLKDPRLNIFINDGRQHLRMSKKSYDLITLEPPPLKFAGVNSLYSYEFYLEAFEKLKDGGVLSQWLPIHQVKKETSLSMVKAFLSVFPNAVMANGSTGHLILIGRKKAPLEMNFFKAQGFLQNHPKVLEDLKLINMGTALDLLGSFMSSSDQMRAATIKVSSLTDNKPYMEFGSARVLNSEIPTELFSYKSFNDWCESCEKSLPELSPYLKVLSQIYSSTPFRNVNILKKHLNTDFRIELNGDANKSITQKELERLVNESPYLKSFFLTAQ